MVSGPLLPDWLTYDAKDSEARRRASTDVARRRGRAAVTATPVPTPTPTARPAPEENAGVSRTSVDSAGQQPRLLGFREWAEMNTPDLIGRKFVPRQRLEAAKNGYARYVMITKQRREAGLAERGMVVRESSAKAREREGSARSADYERRANAPPSLQQRAEDAASKKFPEDPMGALGAISAAKRPPAAPPSLQDRANAAASAKFPDDPMGALGAVSAAKRPPAAPPSLQDRANAAASAKFPDDPMAALGAVSAAKRPPAAAQPFVPTAVIGKQLSGDPQDEGLLPGVLEKITQDPIGGFLEALAWVETQSPAWTPQQRKQVAEAMDRRRPTLDDLNKAWADGYFGGGEWFGGGQVEAKAKYVAAIKAILRPEEVDRLRQMDRSMREE